MVAHGRQRGRVQREGEPGESHRAPQSPEGRLNVDHLRADHVPIVTVRILIVRKKSKFGEKPDYPVLTMTQGFELS